MLMYVYREHSQTNWLYLRMLQGIAYLQCDCSSFQVMKQPLQHSFAVSVRLELSE